MTDKTGKTGAWVGLETGEGNLKYQDVDLKTEDEDDIDVKVLYCGLCGSDHSALLGHFGPLDPPRVCGHELVGTVVRAGPKATFKVGDMVGVGAQCDSCRECPSCRAGEEQFCQKFTFTYGGGKHPVGAAKGEPTRGGFAKMWRGSSRFAVPIPSSLDPAVAGPLLCGGITVYSPLKRHGAGTTAKRVGILGIGGLGHMGIQIAKALGAEVTAISRGSAKKEDALKLGATNHIATTNDLESDFKDHVGTLDLIICTINPSSLPVNDYLSLLAPKGTFVIVGVVPKPLEIKSTALLFGARAVAGSMIGSPAEMKDLLKLAADKGITPWVQMYDFDDINKALVDFGKGLPKYRFVLANKDNGGKL